MILQSLVRYYERTAMLAEAQGDVGLAPVGFVAQAVSFVIVVDADGGFVTLADLRVPDPRGKYRAKQQIVPGGTKKTSGIAANLLWDTAEYALGVETVIKGKTANPARIRDQHAAFRRRIDELPETVRRDPGIAAVIAFLSSSGGLAALVGLPTWEDVRTTNPVMSFQLQHDSELVCQRAALRDWWMAQSEAAEADGVCVVTGRPAVIERLHPSIKGVWGAQSSGASVVSFNCDAFTHYGREQGANASVGKGAAAMYTTALNNLLRDERHVIRIGDASTVFWAEEPRHPVVSAFRALFGAGRKDDPTMGASMVRQVFDSVRRGALAEHGEATTFHVLGLAPNAARLSIRFWRSATVAELSPRFAAHLDALDIVRPSFEADAVPNLFRLLLSCALLRKADNIPPSLGGDVIRAVLDQRPYPATLFNAALRRCRAEQDVDFGRAAILKACLIRNHGLEELTVTLDPGNNAPAYLLGQLLMIFERIQKEALGDINRTVKDTYWSAAMAEPQRTFPRLFDLSEKHLKKIQRDNAGRAENLRKLIGDRVGRLYPPRSSASDTPLPPFPKTLASADQGLFIVGYYHQRQHESTYKTPGVKQDEP